MKNDKYKKHEMAGRGYSIYGAKIANSIFVFIKKMALVY